LLSSLECSLPLYACILNSINLPTDNLIKSKGCHKFKRAGMSF